MGILGDPGIGKKAIKSVVLSPLAINRQYVITICTKNNKGYTYDKVAKSGKNDLSVSVCNFSGHNFVYKIFIAYF